MAIASLPSPSTGPPAADDVPVDPRSRRQRWLLIAAVFLSFAAFATLRSPVPGVNEPHYLCKAKHFWDPGWCRRDPFLASANAHYAFYATVGALTRWCTLTQTAWICRLLGWLLLAVGWSELVRRLVPHRWAPVWSAWLFLALAATGNFSGEWIVGGIEAKVLSYGLICGSLACLAARRATAAAACAGLAVAFHPVVGLWSVAAVGFAAAWQLVETRTLLPAPSPRRGRGVGGERAHASWPTAPENGRRAQQIIPLLVFVACSLPGLIPALEMLREASPAVAAQADRIQVFDRLKHHLDPRQFPPRAYVGYAALVVIWLALRRSAARTEAEAFFTRYVLGCTLIALAGLAIGWCDWPTAIMRQPGLMKFYPFRLADAFIPMAAAVTAAGCAARWLQAQLEGQAAEKLPRRTVAISLLFAAAFVWSLAAPAVDRNPGRMSPERTADWLAICRWIERETPPDALFWVKGDGFGFKWYAARAEFFSVKDCPQDAAGIVAWHDHIRQLFEWDQRQPQGKYSAAALKQLHRETAIDYVVARPHEFEPRPVYQNDSFAVLKASVQ